MGGPSGSGSTLLALEMTAELILSPTTFGMTESLFSLVVQYDPVRRPQSLKSSQNVHSVSLLCDLTTPLTEEARHEIEMSRFIPLPDSATIRENSSSLRSS